MPDRNQTWSSVKKKQASKTFTVDEVKEIVAEAVAAIKEGREVPNFEKEIEEKKEQPEKEFVIGGK
jgi:hypothetical protein